MEDSGGLWRIVISSAGRKWRAMEDSEQQWRIVEGYGGQ
jgi:hypothetical protein